MENLCINLKLKNLTRWENNLLQSISKSAEHLKKSVRIALPQIIAHIFWSFSNGLAWINGFSNQNFRFAYVNSNLLHLFQREIPSGMMSLWFSWHNFSCLFFRLEQPNFSITESFILTLSELKHLERACIIAREGAMKMYTQSVISLFEKV